jgi:hypothetical protein
MKYYQCSLITAEVSLSYAAWTQTPGTGHVQVKVIRSYSGASLLSKPTAIVVYNFAATPEEVELNKSAHRPSASVVCPGPKTQERTHFAWVVRAVKRPRLPIAPATIAERMS